MLTVIIAAKPDAARLPALLAALTPAAVDGLVREVIIAGGGPPGLLDVLREETGAELADDLAAAIARARSAQLLVLDADIRLRPTWLERLTRHLAVGGGAALLKGAAGGFWAPRRFGVLMSAAAAARLAHPDLHGLRRQLPRAAVRLD